MQKARSHSIHEAPTACMQTVSSPLSTSSPDYFSPFLHSTSPLSVSYEYLALPDGAGRFSQGTSCPNLLRIQTSITPLSLTGLSPPMADLPRSFR